MASLEMEYWKMFKLGFTTICIGTALGMCSYCAYKYHLDEEVAQIEYRTFHKSTDDIYPQASLCFRDPFSKAKLLKHQINESAYLKYLKGEHVMGDFSDVSYNNITIDLSEYVVVPRLLEAADENQMAEAANEEIVEEARQQMTKHSKCLISTAVPRYL